MKNICQECHWFDPQDNAQGSCRAMPPTVFVIPISSGSVLSGQPQIVPTGISAVPDVKATTQACSLFENALDDLDAGEDAE